MRLLITGAGGFVGSVLLTKLPKEYEIICLGHSTNYDRLRKFVGDNVKLIEGEIFDEQLVNELMNGVDVVIHLVGIGGTPICLKDPVDAVLTNIHGTNVLVNSAVKNNVKKFIFTSTYIAYSVLKQREIPFTEEMKLEPDDFYGSLKAAAESSVMNFPGFVILRLSTIYGYGLGFGASLDALTMNLIKSAYQEGIINLRGSGSSKFDLLHVDDLYEAIKLILGNLEKAIYTNGETSRENMMKAANLAGKVINITKTTACHSISYPLTSYFNISHGHAVGLTLAEILVYNSQVSSANCLDKRGVNYVKKTINDLTILIGKNNPYEAKNKIQELMQNIGLETKLSQLGLKKEDINIVPTI